MRVVILHNAVSADARADERDVWDQVAAVFRAVRELGHEPAALPCTLDLESAKTQLLAARPDAVFNLVESLGGSDRMMFLATALLDAIGLPYTGSATDAVFLTTNKPLAKWLLRQRGLPTPDWIEPAACGESRQEAPAGGGDFTPGARYIIKPAFEHASLGLDDDAVVTCETANELRALVQRRQAKCSRPMFAERFIDGREFNLSLLAGPDGPQVLPPAEIDFSAFPPGKLRIVGYRAKWEEASFEFRHTPRTFDIAGDRALTERLAELSRACWRCFGLSGWARVDFRVDERGRPYILEVNANPCLSPDAGFAAALAPAGIPFAAAIERILTAATG
ncbi:MAG: D-alanine--D-alanine ligase [Planctomycetia bacterium]|nr:D-alanine--D-alanine ligase [Planctomycetia bacterium]